MLMHFQEIMKWWVNTFGYKTNVVCSKKSLDRIFICNVDIRICLSICNVGVSIGI